MQTEQTLTQGLTLPAVDLLGKIGYPINRLISVFDDWTSLNRAINTLVDAGVELHTIEVLYGSPGVQRLSAAQPGGRIMNWLECRLSELGPERELLRSYRADLRSGRLLLIVRYPRPLPQAILHQSLTTNGGHATHFFGRFAVHTFSP